MDALVSHIIDTESALESIARLRNADKSVDFESIWQFLNQYRQATLGSLNIAQEAELELVHTKQWIESDKPKKRDLQKHL